MEPEWSGGGGNWVGYSRSEKENFLYKRDVLHSEKKKREIEYELLQ